MVLILVVAAPERRFRKAVSNIGTFKRSGENAA